MPSAQRHNDVACCTIRHANMPAELQLLTVPSIYAVADDRSLFVYGLLQEPLTNRKKQMKSCCLSFWPACTAAQGMLTGCIRASQQQQLVLPGVQRARTLQGAQLYTGARDEMIWQDPATTVVL